MSSVMIETGSALAYFCIFSFQGSAGHRAEILGSDGEENRKHVTFHFITYVI